MTDKKIDEPFYKPKDRPTDRRRIWCENCREITPHEATGYGRWIKVKCLHCGASWT
jgi:hypothetical protein